MANTIDSKILKIAHKGKDYSYKDKSIVTLFTRPNLCSYLIEVLLKRSKSETYTSLIS